MLKPIFQEPNFKQELTSDFNEAKNQIYRLHELYTKCHSFSQNGDLTKLKWALDRIWIELASDARKKFGEDLEKNECFIEIKRLNNEIAKGQDKREILYKLLQEKEIFLRFLQDDVGKGGKRSSTDEDDFD